jgi:hypothetical protein
MMTKQEERAALGKIEKILTAAGPDSYIGMAFDGCVEYARSNIENDFGDSWKLNADKWQRCHNDEHKLRIQCQNRISELAAECEKHIAEKDQLRDQLKESQDRTIPGDLYDMLVDELKYQMDTQSQRIDHCVDVLASFADCPHDIAVADALRGLSTAKAKKAKYSQLIERLIAYKFGN